MTDHTRLSLKPNPGDAPTAPVPLRVALAAASRALSRLSLGSPLTDVAAFPDGETYRAAERTARYNLAREASIAARAALGANVRPGPAPGPARPLSRPRPNVTSGTV